MKIYQEAWKHKSLHSNPTMASMKTTVVTVNKNYKFANKKF